MPAECITALPAFPSPSLPDRVRSSAGSPARSGLRALSFISLAALVFGIANEAAAGPLPKGRPAAAPSQPGVGAKPKVTGRAELKDDLRFVAATPEQMLRQAADRSRRAGADGLVGIAIAASLYARVPVSLALSTLLAIRSEKDERIGDEARWVASSMSPDARLHAPAGLLRDWAIVGPFEDKGGGVLQREGPEDGALTDLTRTFDRGSYEVRWRSVPKAMSTASGLPLDVLISPRQESCSYLASRLSLPAASQFSVHVAAAGALRVSFDERDVGASEETHRAMRFERLAFAVDASAGEHLLVVKSCMGSTQDEGRVRVRVSDGHGQGKDLAWSADLRPAAKGVADSRVTMQRTLMQEAVEVGEHPAARAALQAGLVRTLGAADDERTPRAPGLFDRATHDGGVNADVLALVGWATPFGADRSGRLNAARQLAAQHHDTETDAFAQRRLAALRLEGGFPDWAIAAVQSEPLASASDVEAKLLRAVVAGSMKTLRAASLRQLEQLSREAPETASVWENLAEMASIFDRELAAKAREKLRAIESESDCGAYVRAMMSRGGAAVKAAAARCLGEGVTDPDELSVMGQALIDSGNPDDARALYRLAVQLSPNAAEFWQGLSITSFASGKPEDLKIAQGALARARALNPGDVRLGAEMRLRAHGAQSEDRNLVEPSVFLGIKARIAVRQGEEVDRELYWKRTVEYLADHRIKQTVHYAREIVIAPRSQAELIEAIPPVEGDMIEILRARVHRASGGIAFAEEQQSEGGRPRIRWSRLETGDVVEVAIRTFTAGPVGRRGDPPFYFVDYAGAVETHPLLYNEVVVETPVGQPLAVDVMHGEPDQRSESDHEGKHTLRMVWNKPVNVPDEPLAPHIGESIPTVMASTFGSWKAFLDWYRAAVQGFTEPDEQIRRMALDLTKGATTRDEKLRRLFNYVADSIRYVNYQSSEFWLPNRPQQVIARKQGDCDDKAILLITLLKAVGIEAGEVLVQTRMTAQPTVLQSKKVAVPLFDHGIAFLPASKGQPMMWLDATSPQSRLGPLPAMDARALALFVKEGAAEIVAMPASTPAEHGVDTTWNVVLNAQGGGELSAEERHSGDQAFMLRGSLREPDARAQWVEGNLLAGWFSGMKLDGKVGFDADVGHGEARVSYRARSDGMARREGNEWVVTLAPNSTMTSQLAPLVTRKLPVWLPPYLAPSHQKRVIRVTAPAGYGLGELPPGGEEQGGEFGSARLQIAAEPGHPDTVVVTRSVTLDMSTIPIARYGEWRSWLQRVDTLMHRGIRLVPKAQARKPR